MAKNHHQKEYRHIREVVLWLFDYECIVCKQISEDCQVHHCNNDSRVNALINLAPLCTQCHKMIHKTNARVEMQVQIFVGMLYRKIKELSP